MDSSRGSLVSLRNLEVTFGGRSGLLRRSPRVAAVKNLSLDIMRGELLCLVGESGSGKTTTARAIGCLIRPTAGSVWFDQSNVAHLHGKALRSFRGRVQSVFQDPYDSFSPRQRVGEIVTEPLEVHGVGAGRRERETRAIEALEECGLAPGAEFLGRYPHQLSGGQRQRVSIAAATVLRPELLIADEPVSMLDVSVRAGIIETLMRLRRAHNLTILFVTHDLALAWAFADRIAVMYAGHLLEVGTPEQVMESPAHPYTAALIAAIPEADPDVPLRSMPVLSGAFGAPAGGCCFRLRCPHAQDDCGRAVPVATDLGDAHLSACIRSHDIRAQLAVGPDQRA